MTKILFATETIKTSQGWFEPCVLLPQLNLPLEEISRLLDEKKAAVCDHNSPLASRVHELLKHPHTPARSTQVKAALAELSPETPGDETVEINADEEENGEPSNPALHGEFPTLEVFTAAGYQAENYEATKAAFYRDKTQVSGSTESTTT